MPAGKNAHNQLIGLITSGVDWKTSVDYGFFSTSKIFTAASYGEVWTDDANILRISEHCELPDKARWRNYHAVVTYGWLKRADEPPRLVPVTISAQAELKKKTYWCHGQFTDYKIFGSRVKIKSFQSQPVTGPQTAESKPLFWLP